MPVPTKITDLSVNEALNSPAGTENVGSPGSVDNYFRSIQAILRSESLSKSWESRGDVPTFISTTSFSVPGDQTSFYRPNRRVLCVGATTIVGTILTSTFNGTITTVTILPDSGVLDVTLSVVALGIDPLAVGGSAEGLTARYVIPIFDLRPPTSGPQTFDFFDGSTQRLVLTGNASITAINNVPTGGVMRIGLDMGSPTAFTLTWPASVHWTMGVAPNLGAGPLHLAWVDLFGGSGGINLYARADIF